MAKVLLVNPPFYRLLGSHYNGLTLGLAYIASSLNADGHDAWVYNADYSEDRTYKTLHQIYETFDGFDQKPIDDCIACIVEFRPDLVGYTCYTAVIPALQQITAAVKRLLPDTKQIIGGPHPTLDPDTKRLFPDADCVVQGEGEHVLRTMAKNGVPFWFVKAERITDLDSLPFPERQKFWRGTGKDVSYLSTARGCPWRCAYCGSPGIWPRVYWRSPENVIAEVQQLPIRFSLGACSVDGKLAFDDNASLYIVDDTFTFNHTRALAIMKGLQGIPWKCEARADTITDRLAEEMARTGCLRVKMGIESGSDRILRIINKGETTDQMRKAVRLLQKYSVPVTCYLMAGFPGETDDDLRQTIAFARELQADYYSISMVAPYYGTRLYEDAITAGIPVDSAPWQVFFHHNDARLLNPNLSRSLIEELWSLCDIRRYV